jgi:hypothetical protein
MKKRTRIDNGRKRSKSWFGSPRPAPVPMFRADIYLSETILNLSRILNCYSIVIRLLLHCTTSPLPSYIHTHLGTFPFHYIHTQLYKLHGRLPSYSLINTNVWVSLFDNVNQLPIPLHPIPGSLQTKRKSSKECDASSFQLRSSW